MSASFAPDPLPVVAPETLMTPEKLITKLSAILAQSRKLDDFLRELVTSIAVSAGAAWFRVDIAGAPGLPESHVEIATNAMAGAGARFEITRNLEVRGVRYGRMTFEVRNPGWTPAELFQFTDVLAQQIALAAETFALRTGKSRMQDELRATRQDLAAGKAITRASGMLAAQRGWTEERALDWLRQQAARNGQGLGQLAAQFVEGVMVQRRVQRGGTPLLARTA